MALSPMMCEYKKTKEEYKDCILFYRLGDFYEMFFEDAIVASKELELTLTGKECGLEERAPMCGVPFHAVDNYISKLIQKGYKVAIGEQVEDPKQAKGLVKREVIRVVTPGTNIDTENLDSTKNNYLMCVITMDNLFGISLADITTGDCMVTEVSSKDKLIDEIYKFSPAEIICNDSFFLSGIDLEEIYRKIKTNIYKLDTKYLNSRKGNDLIKSHFIVENTMGLGIDDYPCGKLALESLFLYLEDTQKTWLSQICKIKTYSPDKYMIIDSNSRRNLEIVETMREKQKKGSLLGVLDKTKTAMGARMLRSFMEQPLINIDEINSRLEAIEEINNSLITRDEVREYLNPIYDLERLISRVSFNCATPRDIIALCSSLEMIPHIKTQLLSLKSPLLTSIVENIYDVEEIYTKIRESIVDEPPLAQKEGGIIKDGFNDLVDKYRESRSSGKLWLSKLENEEKEKTGIKNLKIKYSKVFGYSFEVTNSYKHLVPANYIRKQTLTNAERYITEELKELESTIIGASDKLCALEYEIFSELRTWIGAQIEHIQRTAKAIAYIDVLTSLAFVAEKNMYVRPKLNKKGILDIKNGRHPVVERMINDNIFVPNDTILDNKDNRVSIITGPNMAGKSTYMRQTALIVLMAQIGSFVPCDEANISIVDRIFTRVGASDDLASGQSTFMVEMTEVANIIRNATVDSLLILDEIGRGTSTFDGLSIAWAVVEHIANIKLCGAKALFATHYHELTELEGKISGVKNYAIAVKEKDDNITFLRKIVRGGADKSYGIAVAKLAGVPDSIIKRANELVLELSDADITAFVKNIQNVKTNQTVKENSMSGQISLLDTVNDDSIINEIKELDLNDVTPRQAFEILSNLQNKVLNRW